MPVYSELSAAWPVLELGDHRHQREHLDGQKRQHETAAPQALAELLGRHRIESLGQIVFPECFQSRASVSLPAARRKPRETAIGPGLPASASTATPPPTKRARRPQASPPAADRRTPDARATAAPSRETRAPACETDRAHNSAARRVAPPDDPAAAARARGSRRAWRKSIPRTPRQAASVGSSRHPASRPAGLVERIER